MLNGAGAGSDLRPELPKVSGGIGLECGGVEIAREALILGAAIGQVAVADHVDVHADAGQGVAGR